MSENYHLGLGKSMVAYDPTTEMFLYLGLVGYCVSPNLIINPFVAPEIALIKNSQVWAWVSVTLPQVSGGQTIEAGITLMLFDQPLSLDQEYRCQEFLTSVSMPSEKTGKKEAVFVSRATQGPRRLTLESVSGLLGLDVTARSKIVLTALREKVRLIESDSDIGRSPDLRLMPATDVGFAGRQYRRMPGGWVIMTERPPFTPC